MRAELWINMIFAWYTMYFDYAYSTRPANSVYCFVDKHISPTAHPFYPSSIHIAVLCDCGIRVTHGVLCGSLLHLRPYVSYIGKGVLVQQRLSAMTSSVLLIRNVGTWKIVITVLTELHRQRLRAPHCELLQAETGSLRRKASHCCLTLHCAPLQRVRASREARTVPGTHRLLQYQASYKK